jgi:hypothetical protein
MNVIKEETKNIISEANEYLEKAIQRRTMYENNPGVCAFAYHSTALYLKSILKEFDIIYNNPRGLLGAIDCISEYFSVKIPEIQEACLKVAVYNMVSVNLSKMPKLDLIDAINKATLVKNYCESLLYSHQGQNT